MIPPDNPNFPNIPIVGEIHIIPTPEVHIAKTISSIPNLLNVFYVETPISNLLGVQLAGNVTILNDETRETETVKRAATPVLSTMSEPSEVDPPSLDSLDILMLKYNNKNL